MESGEIQEAALPRGGASVTAAASLLTQEVCLAERLPYGCLLPHPDLIGCRGMLNTEYPENRVGLPRRS